MDLINKYLTEKTYDFSIKKDEEGWYLKPQMMGHKWNAPIVDSLEDLLNTYNKSVLQKWIIKIVYGTPEEINNKTDWHFFNNITKKDLASLQYVLRRVDKAKSEGMYNLLWWLYRKSGLLKSRLTWALELLAYKHDYDNYLKGYSSGVGFYGLKGDQAKERFDRYHQGLLSRQDLEKAP